MEASCTTNPSIDVQACPEKHNATNLSPIKLVKHLAVYGDRDPTAPGIYGLDDHYHTTQGYIINFFTKQGVYRDHSVHGAFALQFSNYRDRYSCTWNAQTQHVEVVRCDAERITILLD